MKVLFYIFGSLGIFIFGTWYLYPYIHKVLFLIKVKYKLKRIANNTEGEANERLNELDKIITRAIKEEEI